MSFNGMAIFDKLAEKQKINDRYNEARKVINFWVDRYENHRSRIKWAECKISTEKENLLDNLFFASDARRLLSINKYCTFINIQRKGKICI